MSDQNVVGEFLIDFGIAKADAAVAPRAEGQAPLTQEDLLVGTPEYMSPEQARGAPVDQRTDTWAVGVVLCECLTGKRPFRGETPMDVIMAVLQDELAMPWELNPGVEVAPEVWSVVRRALSKEPKDRFSSATQMRQALEVAAAVDGYVSARTPAGVRRPATEELAAPDDDNDETADRDEWARYVRRQRRQRTALAFVAVAALGGGAVYVAPTLSGAPVPAPTEEREPNNDAATANPLRSDSSTAGTLGVPQQGTADRDLFTMDLPDGPYFVDVRVEPRGPVRANLGLTGWVDGKVLWTGWGRRLPTSGVRRMVLDGKRLVIMVREENATSDVPPTPTEIPYRLTVGPVRPVTTDEEREPDNRCEQATVLNEGVTMQADLSPPDDEDQFRLHLPADDGDHRLEVAPVEGLAVDVALVAPDGRAVLKRGGREGEKVGLPVSARKCGTPCTVVITADRGVPANAAYTVRWK